MNGKERSELIKLRYTLRWHSFAIGYLIIINTSLVVGVIIKLLF